MKLTDGKRTVAITMFEWNSEIWKPDWSLDFFNAGKLDYNDETDTYTVDNVIYCIDQAIDWQYHRGDYEDEAGIDLPHRLVSIRPIKEPLQFTWYVTAGYNGCIEYHKLYRGIPEIDGGWLMQTRGNPVTSGMSENESDDQEANAILSDNETKWWRADGEDYQYVAEWLDIWNLK